MRKLLFTCLSIISFSFMTSQASAHCEIPCGIYNDSVRVKLIYEHIQTIEKSINEINRISKMAKPDYNQLTRWVNNKEEHANKIQETVGQYFLHQRIKLVDQNDRHAYTHYVQKLELLHKLSVYAMKTKQSPDLTNVSLLKSTLAAFEKAYFTHSH